MAQATGDRLCGKRADQNGEAFAVSPGEIAHEHMAHVRRHEFTEHKAAMRSHKVSAHEVAFAAFEVGSTLDCPACFNSMRLQCKYPTMAFTKSRA